VNTKRHADGNNKKKKKKSDFPERTYIHAASKTAELQRCTHQQQNRIHIPGEALWHEKMTTTNQTKWKIAIIIGENISTTANEKLDRMHDERTAVVHSAALGTRIAACL
jgi:hypothetical protein